MKLRNGILVKDSAAHYQRTRPQVTAAPEVVDIVAEVAKRVYNNLPEHIRDEYYLNIYDDPKYRARATIVTGTKHAKYSDRKHNNLIKALHAEYKG